jgi:phosphotransacetylase
MNTQNIADGLLKGLSVVEQREMMQPNGSNPYRVLKAKSEFMEKRLRLVSLVSRVDQIKEFFTTYQNDLDGLAELQKTLEQDINDLTAQMQREAK